MNCDRVKEIDACIANDENNAYNETVKKAENFYKKREFNLEL